MADEEQQDPWVEDRKFPLRRRRRGGSAEELAASAAEFEQFYEKFIAASLGVWKYERPRASNFKSEILYPPTSENVREIYDSSRSLFVFANELKLGRSMAIKTLAAAGIDICQEVAHDWEGGCSVRDLSDRHAVTRETIARWIRRSGRDMQPRNGNRKHDEALIVRTFSETNSVNQSAKAAGVHWATARRALRKQSS